MNPRYERGIQMAATRRVVKGRDGGYAYVQSQTDPRKWYRISEDGVCECLDYFYRNKQIRACKHAYCVVAKEGIITQ